MDVFNYFTRVLNFLDPARAGKKGRRASASQLEILMIYFSCFFLLNILVV